MATEAAPGAVLPARPAGIVLPKIRGPEDVTTVANYLEVLEEVHGIAAGRIATRSGAIMASEDNFVIRVRGRGGHAARPHMGVDALVVAAEIVLALQTVVSRSVDPSRSAVVIG